jgi:hypothetical protein
VFVPAGAHGVRENPRMAQKTVVLLEDDLDGGTADETVTFALDGVQYEMDLSTANATGLREVLAPYVGAGRRIGGRTVTRRRVGGGGPARTDREQLAAIRAWARGRGFEVSDRGRIAAHILEAYNAGSAPPAEEPAPAEAPSPRGRQRRSG